MKYKQAELAIVVAKTVAIAVIAVSSFPVHIPFSFRVICMNKPIKHIDLLISEPSINKFRSTSLKS